jgi:predicted DNA-binding antitoxin AbrB/MazE fold protein
MPTLATASAPQDDEQIGYGKPPKSGQFKPGQSGNPKGRPKGRKGINTIIDDVFRKKVSLREGGKVKKISQVEALFRRVMNDALKGDPKATDQALKLLQMMNNMREQSAFGDDGTTPDLAAIEQMLALHDVTVPPAEEGGGE